MPDWTYQTVFRPLLRCLPYSAAQALAFGTMGRLGRWGLGRQLIRFLGHARPASNLKMRRADMSLVSPVGLGCGVDVQSRAVSATSLFGFGLIEIGPVGSVQATNGVSETEWSDIGIRLANAAPAVTIQELQDRLRDSIAEGVQLLIRVHGDEPETVRAVVDCVAGISDVAGISLPLTRTDSGDPDFPGLHERAEIVRAAGLRSFLVVRESEAVAALGQLQSSPPHCPDALVMQLGVDAHGVKRLPANVCGDSPADIARMVKDRLPHLVLVAAGGVSEPAEALALLDGGFDLVLVDCGLPEAGPGLPKRINEALHSRNLAAAESSPADDVPVPHRSWFWSMLLGISLTVGGILAVVIGWTRVVLPYDEEFLGMLRDEICGLNEQLLPFMSHDRVTLAGTMLALGPMYLCLSWYGDRRGMHWARTAVLASSLVGFLSFFTFLGFGYFDPFHAFISAILFQFMALGLRSTQVPELPETLDLHNSVSWKRALWGQLLMVVHGVAILVAGVTISCFGMTTVFVAQDLEFMNTTREALVQLNPRLVPVVAHDRASFGGMLMATGVVVLLSALWGWRRGRRWLWWSLTATGTVAYTTTILIHWWVGYTSLVHLLPAYGGLLLLWLAMLLSRGWMFETHDGGDVISFSSDETQ